MWFTYSGRNEIGRITMGGVRSYMPLPECCPDPNNIITGPDGRLWFTEGVDAIGAVSTAGTFSQYGAYHSGSQGITVGPDGALWFTGDEEIERITPSGALSHFWIPSNSIGIVAGPDASLWFTESNHKIGVLR
jgi:virginiamycin B lyase